MIPSVTDKQTGTDNSPERATEGHEPLTPGTCSKYANDHCRGHHYTKRVRFDDHVRTHIVEVDARLLRHKWYKVSWLAGH
jgi:hypothetical protein